MRIRLDGVCGSTTRGDLYQAELSPAYDFVSTIVYRQFHSDTLALNLDRSKEFGSVTPATFRRFGEPIGCPRPAELEILANAFADKMRATWHDIAADRPPSLEMTKLLTARMHDLLLLRAD